jgi:hypothetical protein
MPAAKSPINSTNTSAEDDACYLALKARDALCDRRFFTASQRGSNAQLSTAGGGGGGGVTPFTRFLVSAA